LVSSGSNSGIVGGFVDGWAVSDFLNSRDCMLQLDRKLGLRRYLARSGLDPLNQLASDASEDELYRAYQSSVNVSYNMLEQVDVMKVSAFSPKDAAIISQALIDLAQEFVNNMDEKGIADALKVSRNAVALAEQQDIGALSALANWRVAHGNMDPAANAAMLLNLVGQIEGELNTAQINLDKVRALDNPNHPMLRPAQMQVASLRERLVETQRRMSGTGDTEAGLLKSYEALKNAQTFADANLVAARQSYQQAFTDTLRLQRYLSVITRPVPEDSPSSPHTLMLLLEALALGFVLAFLGTMGASFYRGLQNG
jgi:capsular polysaccharide transport system permease protein